VRARKFNDRRVVGVQKVRRRKVNGCVGEHIDKEKKWKKKRLE
jgi:hypothetical protein